MFDEGSATDPRRRLVGMLRLSGVFAEETSAATIRRKTCSAPPVVGPQRSLGSLEPGKRQSPTDRVALLLQFHRGATQIAQPTAAASLLSGAQRCASPSAF
jgi:hypothetical protein